MKFYLYTKDETVGPFSLDDVKAYLKQGSITKQTLAAPDGASEWVPLGDLPDFKDAVEGDSTSVLQKDVTPFLALAIMVIGGFIAATSLLGLGSPTSMLVGAGIFVLGIFLRAIK